MCSPHKKNGQFVIHCLISYNTSYYVPSFKCFIMHTIYMIVVNKSKAIRKRERERESNYTKLYTRFLYTIFKSKETFQYDRDFNM